MFKDLLKLVKEANNIELHEGILEVKGRMLELEEINQQLKKEVSLLEEKLSLKEKLIFDNGVYWIAQDPMSKDKTDTPICPTCYDKNGGVMRLKVQVVGYSGENYIECPDCKTYITIEEGRSHRGPNIQRR